MTPTAQAVFETSFPTCQKLRESGVIEANAALAHAGMSDAIERQKEAEKAFAAIDAAHRAFGAQMDANIHKLMQNHAPNQ